MTARKHLEAYWVWMFFNLLAVYNHILTGHLFFALKYVVYFFVSIYGLASWRHQYHQQKK
jgi:nicotinamide riboside transporter PnuC